MKNQTDVTTSKNSAKFLKSKNLVRHSYCYDKIIDSVISKLNEANRA